LAVAEKQAEPSATPGAPPPEPAAVRPLEPESTDLPEPSESIKPADAKEPTTPVKSTQTPTTPQVPSTSSIAALKEFKLWTSHRRILVSALVLLLLALAGFLVWPRHQKVAKQRKQPAIANPKSVMANPKPVTANIKPVIANPKGLSNPPSSSFKTLTAPIPETEVIPPRPNTYFSDYAGVISSDAASQFNEQLAQFERETSNQVVVAIRLKMVSTAPIDGYTRRIANAWGVGQANRQNGVILFVFVQDRKMFMQVGEGLADVLPNTKATDIVEHRIKPHFASNDYEGGVREGLSAICDAARQAGFRGNGKTNAEPRSGAATSPSE